MPRQQGQPSRVEVREHRKRLRLQGLRPIQIWVPDVRAPSFRSQAHRQSLAVARRESRPLPGDPCSGLTVGPGEIRTHDLCLRRAEFVCPFSILASYAALRSTISITRARWARGLPNSSALARARL